MAKIRLVKKKTNEMSGTGGSASATPGTGAQYAAPKAFPRVASDYNKTFGTHFAPSIPNRPSKAITYKEMWEEYGEFDMEDSGPDYNSISDLEDELRRLTRWSNQYGSKGADAQMDQLRKRIEYLKTQATSVNENTDSVVATLNNPKLDPDVKKLLFKGYRDGHLTADKVVKIVQRLLMKEDSADADSESESTFGRYSDDADFDWANGQQSQNPLPATEENKLNEARYSEFKRTTQVRTPSEQMHRAVREIRRKIDEINKLVDYTEKMKSEMKSDVNEVRYLNRTKEALSKISAKVQETNNKIKRLVQ
jgi:predicted RNase H-like nuclease (RuvC/YqgF family)